jgi:hypothetical protein
MSLMAKKRRKLKLVAVGSIIIAIVLVIVIVAELNKPAQGTISGNRSGTLQQTAAPIDLTPTPGGGRYVSFNYPAALEQTVSSQLVTPDVASYDYTYHDIESWNLEIVVFTNPSGQLTNDSPYTYRKAHPDIYQESQASFNNQAVDIMTDKTAEGFSKVAFLIHGQYQATVSLYGDDAAGPGYLQTSYNMVLNSWHWLTN